MSRRWRRSWRIPGRCRFRGVGQQPTKRDCATNRKRGRNRAKTSLFSCESSLFSCKSSLFREMKLPVPVPGAAVARLPRPISAAGRRHGGAPSAPRLLRPQAAVKIVGESHILCYVCSFGPSPGESVMSHRLHRGPSPSAMGLDGCSAQPPPRLSRGPLRGLLNARRGCEQEPALAQLPDCGRQSSFISK